jgi:hypothetical protein
LRIDSLLLVHRLSGGIEDIDRTVEERSYERDPDEQATHTGRAGYLAE